MLAWRARSPAVFNNIVDAGLAKRQTASAYLQQLAQIGVLQQRRAGREQLYLNTRLLGVLGGEEDWPPFTAPA